VQVADLTYDVSAAPGEHRRRHLDVDPLLLTTSPEQEELRAVVRDFLRATSPPEVVRAHVDSGSGYDATSWSRLAAELGVHGLAVPEAYGGSGYSFAELAVVLEEAGRALLCAPLFSTVVLAATALLHSDDEEACGRYLPAIVAGGLVATVGLPEGPGARAAGCTAERRSDRWAVSGTLDCVLDGDSAGLVLLLARTPAGPTLFACERGSHGFVSEPMRVLDGTRPQARLVFREARATPVGQPGEGDRITGAVVDVALAAIAAEQVGGSAYALEQTVAYVGERRQFGRPIGSFQAVKHRLADLLVDIEAARSVSAFATSAAATGSSELPVAASAAKAVCSETFTRAVAELVQLHGGMGFTWEHPAHLYVRRARSSEVLLGTPTLHRRRVAELAGLIN
jgi:alkylation response protein AidB-like acyl-CoA dehydrogenase